MASHLITKNPKTTWTYTLSLHDALPICGMVATNAAGAHTLKYGSTREWVTALDCIFADGSRATIRRGDARYSSDSGAPPLDRRSEEHTSELQSRLHLVCRLLLETQQNAS